MSRKALGILSLITGIFVVLAIVGQVQRNTAPIAGNSVGEPLIAGLAADLDGIEQLQVSGAGDVRLVTLAHNDGDWTVAELGDYPAERSTVNSLLIALADARIVEEKTADPAFHSRLGLEDISRSDATGIGLTILTSAGSFSILLGDAYTGGQRYARLAGADQTVLIDRNPDIPQDPSAWVDPSIIDIAGNRVQRVEISHADGERLTLTKTSPADTNFTVLDIPTDRELQFAGIGNATGNVLQGLRLDNVEPRAREPGDPTSTSEFFTFDGLVVSVMTYADDDTDGAWLAFDARYDQDQADAFSPADAADLESAADAGSAEEPDDSAAREEARELAARLADWQYQIPSYQVSQLARRMEDLLNPVAVE